MIGEIHDLKSSPYDKRIFACSYLEYIDNKSILSIFKMPENIFEDDSDDESEPKIKIDKEKTSQDNDRLEQVHGFQVQNIESNGELEDDPFISV